MRQPKDGDYLVVAAEKLSRVIQPRSVGDAVSARLTIFLKNDRKNIKRDLKGKKTWTAPEASWWEVYGQFESAE